MHIFITGGSGLTGPSVVTELVTAGHTVTGLARSDKAAARLRELGAHVLRGSLEDLDILREGASAAGGVIHMAFGGNFADPEDMTRRDCAAIDALGQALAGSGKPFVSTSGTLVMRAGHVSTEQDPPDSESLGSFRVPGERTCLAFADQGVRSSVVRLAPTVHGPGDYGFIPFLIAAARRTGVSAYIGDGANRWPAIHRQDAATLYRLAVEKAPAGSALHGAGESAITFETIAHLIGRTLRIPTVSITPEEAAFHFDNPFLARCFATDSPASSAYTRKLLNWKPIHATLLEDMATGDYFSSQLASPFSHAATQPTMRTVRFHGYGEPADVLHMEETTLPATAAGRIRVRVIACGLNPADWALCRGLFPKDLPRGIGLDVSGTVDQVGEGLDGIAVGDAVFGPVDFITTASAGASDFAILEHWARIPKGLDPIHAAALPMAITTAFSTLDHMGLRADHTILINGAGTMMGFAAVQIALLRGSRVIATAGETFADRLRGLGALVTPYGEGMVERVLQLAGRSPDLILDTAPVSGALPALVRIAGDPKRVVTISDFAAAKELGARSNIDELRGIRYDALDRFAQRAAEGKFTIPIARTFPLEDWRAALDVSQSQKARGKLILLP